jgi:hypothetical protein
MVISSGCTIPVLSPYVIVVLNKEVSYRSSSSSFDLEYSVGKPKKTKKLTLNVSRQLLDNVNVPNRNNSRSSIRREGGVSSEVNVKETKFVWCCHENSRTKSQ